MFLDILCSESECSVVFCPVLLCFGANSEHNSKNLIRLITRKNETKTKSEINSGFMLYNILYIITSLVWESSDCKQTFTVHMPREMHYILHYL